MPPAFDMHITCSVDGSKAILDHFPGPPERQGILRPTSPYTLDEPLATTKIRVLDAAAACVSAAMEAICQVLPADIDPLHATDSGSRGRHLAPASRLATVRAYRDARAAAAEVNCPTERFLEQHSTLEPSRRADAYGNVPVLDGTAVIVECGLEFAKPRPDAVTVAAAIDQQDRAALGVDANPGQAARAAGLSVGVATVGGKKKSGRGEKREAAPGTGPAQQRPRRATGKRMNQRL